MFLTWKRESDAGFWVLDAAGNRVLGPLCGEEEADHALKVLVSAFESEIKKYKNDWVSKFSSEYLERLAADRILSLSIGKSIDMSISDAKKIVSLLPIPPMEIEDSEEDYVWMLICELIKRLPSKNYQDAIREDL